MEPRKVRIISSFSTDESWAIMNWICGHRFADDPAVSDVEACRSRAPGRCVKITWTFSDDRSQWMNDFKFIMAPADSGYALELHVC